MHSIKTKAYEFKDYSIVLRPMSPSLYIGGDITPLSFIATKKNTKTQYDTVMDVVNQKKQEENIEKVEDASKLIVEVLRNSVVSIDDIKVEDIDKFVAYIYDENGDKVGNNIINSIFNKIIEISFNIFAPYNGEISLTRQNAEFYNQMSITYKKTPIEIICPNGGYTDMDAFTFNLAVFSLASESRNNLIKKHQIQTVNIL